jgi:hypothetical protein
MGFVGPGYNTNTKRFENTPVHSVVPFLHGSESPVREQTAADNNNALILYSSGSLSVMLCYVCCLLHHPKPSNCCQGDFSDVFYSFLVSKLCRV